MLIINGEPYTLKGVRTVREGAAHIVGGHKTITHTNRVGVHTALVITAHKTFEFEFWKVGVLFLFEQKVFHDALFNAYDPRHQRILHECDALMR